MKSLRAQVMDLPPAERLEHALYLLDALSGFDIQAAGWLCHAYGLTAVEARLFLALNQAFPRALSYEACLTAMYGLREQPSLRTVAVHLSRMKRKLAAAGHRDLVRNVSDFGYAVSRRVTVNPPGLTVVPPRESPWKAWSDEDCAQLKRMVENGSELWALQEELGRSATAIRQKMARMRLYLRPAKVAA